MVKRLKAIMGMLMQKSDSQGREEWDITRGLSPGLIMVYFLGCREGRLALV